MEKREPSWSLRFKTHQSMVLLSLMKIIKSVASLRSHRSISATRLMLVCIYSTLPSLTELKIDQLQLREKSSQKCLMKEKFTKWFCQVTGWILDNHTITFLDRLFTSNHKEKVMRVLWQQVTISRVMLLLTIQQQLTHLLSLDQM